MTLREYYEYYLKNRDSVLMYLSFSELILNSECDRALFPNGTELANSPFSDDISYLPFEYEDDPDNRGGHITKAIGDTLYRNYQSMEVSSLLREEAEGGVTGGYRPLIYTIVEQCMYKYKYKWNGLFKTLLADSQYDMLDNVNEITTETITRTPDLDEVIDETVKQGAQTIGDTYNKGAISGSNSTSYGAKSGSGTGSDSNSTYPFDDDTNAHVKDSNSSSYSSSESAHTDSGSYNELARTDSNSRSIGSKQDTKTVIKSENGTEETELERRRHGNIGVTTSGQLIRDYRLTHEFELVNVIASDIANELLTGVWC